MVLIASKSGQPYKIHYPSSPICTDGTQTLFNELTIPLIEKLIVVYIAKSSLPVRWIENNETTALQSVTTN